MKTDIICPHEQCTVSIADMDLHQLMNDKTFDKFLRYRIKKTIESAGGEMEMLFCPTPDCSYAFSADKYMKEFRCPICKNQYCVKCKSWIHKDYSCEQYAALLSKNGSYLQRQDRYEIRWAMGDTLTECPHCYTFVERIEDRSAITCPCGWHVCLLCGKDKARCKGGGQACLPAYVRRQRGGKGKHF